VERIYNLACPASPVHYQLDPVRTIQANVLGVTNMLELPRDPRAVLQASTIGGLRRSPGPSPAGILLGQREPDRRPAVAMTRG